MFSEKIQFHNIEDVGVQFFGAKGVGAEVGMLGVVANSLLLDLLSQAESSIFKSIISL